MSKKKKPDTGAYFWEESDAEFYIDLLARLFVLLLIGGWFALLIVMLGRLGD